MLRTSVFAAIFAASISSIAIVDAAAETVELARRGTVLCGGNYRFREQGADKTVNYTIRNYNDSTPIVVERIRLYDATGTLRYDTDVSGMLPTRDNRLGPGDNTLEAHETDQFSGPELVLSGHFPDLSGSERPVQFIVDWKASRKVIPLDISQVRHEFNFVLDDEVARHQYDCRQLLGTGGRHH